MSSRIFLLARCLNPRWCRAIQSSEKRQAQRQQIPHQAARLQRAKHRLDTTTLPIIEIARFNAFFADIYRRRPGEVRRLCRAT